MSDTFMKRKKAATSEIPGYPSAEEISRDRRGFLRILGKGLLGVSALGLARCGGGSGDPIPQNDAAADVVEDQWHTAGIAPPPDTVEDLVQEDWSAPGGMRRPEDTTEEDWALGGAPRPPDTVDVKDVKDDDWVMGGVDMGPEDVKEQDWTGPAGVPPLPDTVSPEDVTDDGGDQKDTFVPGGIMPPPEEE